ncbi:hypothetical protein RFI_11673, partial [Reticulomyxa filosa]
VGMETLALHFVSDISSILTLNSESLDTSYRVLLAGSYRLQVLLQTLCSTYKRMEFEKAKEMKKQLVRGFNDEDLELEALPVGAISRRGSLNEIFGESAAADELKRIGESVAHQKVDQIFSFVQLEVKTRLQNWMEKSMGRTGDAIVRAAETEKWQSDVTKANEMKEDDNEYLSKDEHAESAPKNDDFEDNKMTWAHFVTDSFLFIDNEIAAYFANIKGFPAEAMATATQFYQQLYFLIDYILKIINTSFADIAILDNTSDEGNKINQRSADLSKTTSNASGVNEAKNKERISLSSKMIQGLGKGVTEIADANRRAFGIVYSTFEVVNHGVKVVKDVATSQATTDTDHIKEMSDICYFFFYFYFILSKVTLCICLHLLTDTQFKKELTHLCVKYSSISRIQEVVSDLGPRLLRYIDDLEEPKERVFFFFFKKKTN